MEIKASVRSIRELGAYSFVVPDFQREYLWKPEDQVDRFLLDMDSEYDPTLEDRNGYFIGSIILIRNGSGTYDVIDGQQRLTTIMLAWCVIRDILRRQALERPLAESERACLQTVEDLLCGEDTGTGHLQPRLVLHYEENKNYLNLCLYGRQGEEPEKTASVLRMEGAYQRLYTHFGEHLKEGSDPFAAYLNYFLDRIELVMIESDSLGSALRSFATINQRGVGQTAMDLVQSLLSSWAREDDFVRIKEVWRDIVQQLESCREHNPLRFLKYLFIARYHDGVLREDDLGQWILSSDGKKALEYDRNPVKFAVLLAKAARRYADLVKSTEAMTDGSVYKHVSHIGLINRYKSRLHLIPLLALNDRFRNEDIDYLAQQLEGFFFFSNLLGVTSTDNERRLAGWAVKIRELQARSELEQFVEKELYGWACGQYTAIKKAFLAQLDGDLTPAYRLRFILGRMDNYLRQQAHLPPQNLRFYDRLEVEYILPQTPEDDQLPAGFEDLEDYRLTAKRLGNLTLLESTLHQALEANEHPQANWYAQKCREYGHSNLISTKYLDPNFTVGMDTVVYRVRKAFQLEFPVWDKAAVARRQEILFQLSLGTWTFNGKAIKRNLAVEVPAAPSFRAAR